MSIALGFALVLSVLLLLAAWLDGTRYIIPNKLNGALLLLYPLMLFTVPEALGKVDWLHGLYGFAILFAVGYALFALGVMGGGDVKLFCVLGLWCGMGRSMIDFLVFASLLGGVMTLLLITARFAALPIAARMNRETLPRLLTYGEALPYGIAIGAGFAIVLWSGYIPGLEDVGRAVAPYIGDYRKAVA